MQYSEQIEGQTLNQPSCTNNTYLNQRNSFLELLEIYYNSGRGHLSFTTKGEATEKESGKTFSSAQQCFVAKVLLCTTLSEIQAALSLEFEDLISQTHAWSCDELLKNTALFEVLLEDISSRIGANVRFHNKLSELEIVFSPQAISKLETLDRHRLRGLVFEQLEKLDLFSDASYHVFTSFEYCKVTLFDKRTVVKELLETLPQGVVLALGDSAVDISFLALEPEHLDYRAYYVGPEEEVAEYPTIQTTTLRRREASTVLIKQALEQTTSEREKLIAIIADIDNCLVDLREIMDPKMASLLRCALRRGIRVFLITGGHISNRYYERVVIPIAEKNGYRT